MKAYIKSYLSITKKEWNGMVVLIILIASTLAAPYIYQLLRKDNTINLKEFDKAVAQLSKADSVNSSTFDGVYIDDKIAKPVMFPFNPNNLSVKQWEQLGLSSRQAGSIKHYEAKGGRFFTKEDVKKIYTLSAADFKRLEPYITIPKDVYYSQKSVTGEIIELNSAGPETLTRLKGIGPAFALRIYRYRKRLGGFYNKAQLKEVYGIDTLKFQEIKGEVSVNPSLVRKININTVSFSQLRLFPYLSYKQGSAVVQYRNEHGSYSSIADMKNIAILDEVILRKIEPYIVFK
jgi:DNA uptake protein ComE-like DNA-binding protein